MAGPKHVFRRAAGFPYWTIGMSAWNVLTGFRRGGCDVAYKNRITITRPDTPYEVLIEHHESFATHWAIFTPEPIWYEWINWNLDPSGALFVDTKTESVHREICDRFREMTAVFHGTGPRRWELAETLLAQVLLRGDELKTQNQSVFVDPRIRTAQALLDEHLSSPLSVSDLAARVHMSASHFAHLFREHVGMSPQKYGDQRRVERAKALLLGSDQSIASVAEQVGYRNAFHFSARFRQLTGVSPRDCRRGKLPS